MTLISGRFEPTVADGSTAPGKRCGHSLTAVDGQRPGEQNLILFGGATALESNSLGTPAAAGPNAGIRLSGATNSVHVFESKTGQWSELQTVCSREGDKPTPRAAHAAVAYGNMLVVQGGIGPCGLATGDLHVLDLTREVAIWHRVAVPGEGPGPRYAHVLTLLNRRFLVVIGGNNGRDTLDDVWVLDTDSKPYQWQLVVPEGTRPAGRMYASAAARSDGLLLLCGGRDAANNPLTCAYGLKLHPDGRWEWGAARGTASTPRYQHASAFVNEKLHVSGGAVGGGKLIETSEALAVLDTNLGTWAENPSGYDEDEEVNSKEGAVQDLRRCRHAMAAVGRAIIVYGGLRGSELLDDMIVLYDGPSPHLEALIAGAGLRTSRPWEDWLGGVRSQIQRMNGVMPATQKAAEEEAAAGGALLSRLDNNGERAMSPGGKRQGKLVHRGSHKKQPTPDVRLYHRAVVVAREANGVLGGLVRQLSIDQFDHEARRVSGVGLQSPDPQALLTLTPQTSLTRSLSTNGVHKWILSDLLRPRDWRAPLERQLRTRVDSIKDLCIRAEKIFAEEPTVLELSAPLKIFGDLHGQYGDLMRLFDEYGNPSTAGDIAYIDYLFLGDYVDRGAHSLETILLLLALKVEYPKNVHLIRGNHEAEDINALFGFRSECIERLGEVDGLNIWRMLNSVFNWLPLAALIEDKILCMHGGIGRDINTIDDIARLERPLTMEKGGQTLMDLLWSDPTENDSVQGLQPNARGPGLVTFGPDRVTDFCIRNNLQLIVRAHECVMDGFERFAQGHLITLFSATNYCGTANNAGAILVVGRDLVVVPKLIHPLPPAVDSPSDMDRDKLSPTWMDVGRPPTPVRGRPPQQGDEQGGSLAWF